MSYALVTPATAEPLALDAAKVVCAVDADIVGEEAHIAGLIRAARAYVENELACAGNPLRLAVETWRRTLHYWPRPPWIDLARLPVLAVQEVAYQDAADPAAMTVLAAADFVLDAANARLHCRQPWPAQALGDKGVQVTFVAGYAPDATPPALRQALLLLVAHWFENREAVIAGTEYRAEAAVVPLGVHDLVAPYRVRCVG